IQLTDSDIVLLSYRFREVTKSANKNTGNLRLYKSEGGRDESKFRAGLRSVSRGIFSVDTLKA
ncbi:MAG: hypothetical protein L0338_06405, partial [Acidobacteria bacterium]|nr:hypothetical protein [Acidobacteriota bacterium]